MRAWVARTLRPVVNGDSRATVILDPDGLLNNDDFDGVQTPSWVGSWYELRRWWERTAGRGLQNGTATAIVRASDVSQPRDLPWDIEAASRVVRVLSPVAAQYIGLLKEIPNHLSDAAVRALNERPDPIGACLERVWAVTLSRRATPAKQLEALIELRTRGDVPDSLWPMLRSRLSDAAAASLAQTPPDFVPLQAAWDDWVLNGANSHHNETMSAVGPKLQLLFEQGLLKPAIRTRASLPAWASIGTRVLSSSERVQGLLVQAPPMPTTHDGWVRVATWWGEVRAVMSEGMPADDPVRAAAWTIWREFDHEFRGWLIDGLEAAMSSAAAWPRSVNKIAPFLARRLRDGRTSRVMLIVIDGMGFAQWMIIREASGLSVLEEGASFAMVPTITPVSRQAIFAGGLPLSFPDTILTTAHESRRWHNFWANEGGGNQVQYSKIQGIEAARLNAPHDVNVLGCVVVAVDEIMHGARVLGEMQMMAGVRTWAKEGALNRLVKQASADGFEVWLASDHGNIEAEPAGRPKSPGLEVETAGTRVWLYTSPTLRTGSDAKGTSWDPPGIPTGAFYPMFATGRDGYFNVSTRMTHGGLSFDEVIVPFVRVEV